MPIAIEQVDQGIISSDGSDDTSSYTPAEDDLILVGVFSVVVVPEPSQPTLSGNSMTYDLVRATSGWTDGASFSSRLSLFRAQAGASAAAGPITITHGANDPDDVGWIVWRVTGQVLGNNGADALVQSPVPATGESTTAAVTLAALAQATNLGFLLAAGHDFAAEAGFEPDGGATAGTEVVPQTGTAMRGQWLANDSSPSMTLDDSSFWAAIALEIAEAAGATEYTITAESAAVALTPTDANLEHHRRIAAESSAYAVTATDAALSKGVRLDAESLALALTPTDVGLEHHRMLDLEAASYAITPTDAALAITVQLVAESAAYLITPTDATFDLVRFAETLAYAITPTDANLEHHRALDAESAAYALTGTAAGLEFHRALDLESAAYLITAQDATLSEGADVTLVAESAEYVITPTDATLLRGLRLVAESGAVIASGQDAALLASWLLSAEGASITLTPQDAALASGFRMLADSAAWAITPTAAGLVYDRALDLASLSVLLTAQDVTLTYDGAPIILVPTLDRIAVARGVGFFTRTRD